MIFTKQGAGKPKGQTQMKLNDHEQAMLAGEAGPAVKWALEHQLQVGRMFDAEDMVSVSQAHMMADPESLGEAGVAFAEARAAEGAKVQIPMITDPRGVDLSCYEPLGQTEEMADLERRFIAACQKMGIMMTNTCINYQTIMPPVYGDHVAFGDTGVVIYANSVCGARSNFEGGPSALAAGLTGRTPRYGLHLDAHRQATKRYHVKHSPQDLMDWGALGATIGRMAGSYWEVPVIEGIDTAPTSDQLKHFGAAMASYGSVPLFHIVGITPECHKLDDVGGGALAVTEVSEQDIDSLKTPFTAPGEPVDVVVFAAPQLSLIEMGQLASLCEGRHRAETTDVIICTSAQVYSDAVSMGYVSAVEAFGGRVLVGTCFYQQYAREIGEANGWTRLLSNSAKIVNILGGYGYQPALASMRDCITSAEQGVIVT